LRNAHAHEQLRASSRQRKAKAVHYLEVLGVVHRKHRQLTRFWGKVQRGCLRCYYGNPVRRRQPQRASRSCCAFDDKKENSTAQDENNTSLSFMRTPSLRKGTTFFFEKTNDCLNKKQQPRHNSPTIRARRSRVCQPKPATMTAAEEPSYTYDSGGNLLALKSSNTNGISDTYTYDALDRLSTVTYVTG